MLKPTGQHRSFATLPTFSSSPTALGSYQAPSTWVKPSTTLTKLDYSRGRSIHKNLIDSTFHQNLTVYIAMAASRAVASFFRGTEIKSQRETVEHISRDLPSIFMAYFGAKLLLKTLAVGLFNKDKHKMLHLDKSKLNDGSTWGKRLLNNYRYITKGKMISSEELTDLKNKTLDRFKKIATTQNEILSKEQLKPVVKYFERLKFVRNSVAFTGTLINLLLMGFLIPYANILITQSYVRKQNANKA